MTLDRWAPKILYLSVWLFISRTLGSNGQHTSGSHKSSDSTQVCSPVSSRPVKNGVSVIKRSVGFIFSLYRLLHAPRWANRHREMTSGTSTRHPCECDDAGRCVLDADEPAGQKEHLFSVYYTLYLRVFWTQAEQLRWKWGLQGPKTKATKLNLQSDTFVFLTVTCQTSYKKTLMCGRQKYIPSGWFVVEWEQVYWQVKVKWMENWVLPNRWGNTGLEIV